MRPSKLLATALCLALLAGCHSRPSTEAAKVPTPATSAAPDEAAPVFINDALGLTLAATRGMQLQRNFDRSYLDNGAWESYATPDSQGSPLAALVMDGSNHITAAELRIGASRDPAALSQCTAPPESAMPASIHNVTLDGVMFRHFRAADAAMSHYMQVEGYRAVRNGQCLAIDLLLLGANPAVYAEPPTPPFTQAEAWAKLHEALGGVRFADGSR